MNRRALLTRILAGCLVVNELRRPALADAGVSLTDAAGRTVTVSAPAARIIVTFNYEEFLAVGGPHAFDRVVGYTKTVWYDWRRSIWERYAAVIPKIAQVPDIGFTENNTFSVEKTVALKPDLMIVPRWMFTEIGQNVSQIEAAGIPILVIDYNADQVPTHVVSTLALGQVLGADARARQLAALYASKVADVQARVARARRPRPKVYLELGQDGPATYGNTYGNDFWGALIETAGGNNIAAGKITSAAPLNPEYVIAADPDYIFITGSTWPGSPQSVPMGFGVSPELTNARLKAYLTRPGWNTLTAVKTGRVYAIHHGIARTLFDFAGMQFIAKAMYPTQFADVDPEASMRTYFASYLPVQYDGTWMLQLRR